MIGLEIDLSHFEENQSRLERHGAFKQNRPEVHAYDQLVSGYDRLRSILKGRTLDIVIDDGYHSIDAIVTTWRSVEPFLSPRFVYLIEDYAGLLKVCGKEFASYDCHAFGMLTVVSRGVAASAS